MKGPEFLKYIKPVLITLQANGGAGNSTNVIEQVIEKLGITDEELEQSTIRHPCVTLLYDLLLNEQKNLKLQPKLSETLKKLIVNFKNYYWFEP